VIISKLNIEGFGVFHHKSIEGLAKGVNVLYGRNEAGKSTLLDFIRFTLFDYPVFLKDRRPPLNGGNHGGNIDLQHSSMREITVFRNGNKDFSLTLDGEKTTDLSVYNRLTNFASEQLFNNIFAITVDELNDISKLDESGMKDRIFSMGMGLSNVNLGDIEKKFKELSEAYFKERGKNQELIVITRELNDIEAEISEVQSNVDDYEKLKEQEEKLQGSLSDLKKRLEKLKIERNRLENFQKAFEAFAEMQEGKKLVEKYSDVEIISDDIIQNVRKNREKLDHFLEVQADQKNKLELLATKKDKIQFNELLVSHFDLITYLTANATKYNDAKVRIKQIESDRQKIKDANSNITKGLGEDIEINQLLELSDYAKLRSEAADHQKVYTTLKNQLERCYENNKEVEIAIKEEELFSQQIKKDLERFSANFEELRDRENELTAKIEGLKRTTVFAGSTNGNKKLLFGAIAIILGTIGLTFVNNTLSVITGAVALLLIILYLSSHQKKNDEEKIDHTDLIKKRRIIQDELEELVNHQKKRDETETRLNKLNVRKKNYEEEEQELKNQLTVENGKWEGLLISNHLPTYIKSNQIADVIATSESVKQNNQKTKDLDRENQLLLDFINDFDQKIQPIKAALETDRNNLTDLLNELKSAKEQHILRENLIVEWEELENELSATEDKIQQLENRLKDYYASFGAKNEREFYEKVKKSQEKVKAKELVDQGNKQIAIVSGVNEVASTIAALEKLTKSQIDSELIILDQDIHELENKQSIESEELGGLRERISSLLNIDEMYDLQNKREALKSKLSAAYEEWITNKVILSILNKEKQKYEKEKQPSVIKYSSSIFHDLTAGEYERISISLTDDDVKIHTVEEKIRDIGSLSRGTKEQLLLALRMGFIQAYEEKNEPLPIVLDDVMVNFDNYRSASFAKILSDFVKDRQAIVFTCHKHVRDLFAEQGAKIISW
jgi:uncharacterized protein YhaN